MAQRPYDVLCDELAARVADEDRREHTANQIARDFRAAFASFLGLDDDPEDRLVKLRDLTIEDGEVVFAERGKARGLVLPDKEHNWVFAIVLCISSRDFVCRCSIRFRDHKPELRVADNPKAFPVTPNDPTFQSACQALYDQFRRWLQWRPSSGEPKPQMGFQPSNS